MDTLTPKPDRETSFRDVERFFGGLDAETTARLVKFSADVALVLEDGVVADMAVSGEDLSKEGYEGMWLGKPWVETVTAESREKITALLDDPSSDNQGKSRQVNHPSTGSSDVPIAYTTVRTAHKNRIVALGRDLRRLSALQQSLIQAHQELERDYNRLRDAEARYQALFETVVEPVIIVHGETLEIENANPAALTTLGERRSRLVGAELEKLFAARGMKVFDRLASHAVSGEMARAEEVSLASGKSVNLAVSAFGRGDRLRFILRLAVEGAEPSVDERESVFRDTLDALPDALVMTDTDMRIAASNKAFLDLTHLSSHAQARSAALSDYLGRSPTDLNVLMSSLKEHGTVRNFATVIRDRFGNEEPAEVSAVVSSIGPRRAFGFSIRNVSRRLSRPRGIEEQLPSSVDQLTEMVGRVPLKDIVGDATLLIEKLCIEAALNLTDDNRASAAEILGLSRQGLYSKLKRFGMDDKG